MSQNSEGEDTMFDVKKIPQFTEYLSPAARAFCEGCVVYPGVMPHEQLRLFGVRRACYVRRVPLYVEGLSHKVVREMADDLNHLVEAGAVRFGLITEPAFVRLAVRRPDVVEVAAFMYFLTPWDKTDTELDAILGGHKRFFLEGECPTELEAV